MAKNHWSKEKTSELIEMYSTFPCLYATTSKDYSNKNLRNKALEELATAFSTTGRPIFCVHRKQQS